MKDMADRSKIIRFQFCQVITIYSNFICLTFEPCVLVLWSNGKRQSEPDTHTPCQGLKTRLKPCMERPNMLKG